MQGFSLKGLVGSIFSLVRSFTVTPVVEDNQKKEAESKKEESSLIINPTQTNFQNELRLRTEEFDRHMMAETMKDLEKAVYHLSASVSYLKEQGKKNEELLVFLSTTHEELLHAFEESQLTSMNPEFVANDEEDEVIINKAWDNKKGTTLN